MIRAQLPNGELIEIHEPLVEAVIATIANERDVLIKTLYALTQERNPETLASARKLLHEYGKTDA